MPVNEDTEDLDNIMSVVEMIVDILERYIPVD